MKSENDPIRDGADDAMLDELLGQARWPEADAGAETRLREAYLGISTSRDSLRLRKQPQASRVSYGVLRRVLAVAAVVLVALGVWWLVQLRIARPVPFAVKPDIAPTSRPVRITVAAQTPLVRPLNPAERLAIITDKQLSKKKSTKGALPQPVDPLASLRRLDSSALTRMATATQDATRRRDAIAVILQRNDLQSFLYFVLRPSTREDALSVLDAMPDPPTQALLAELDHQQVDYRLAAAKALGGICNHSIDRKLMTMVRQNDHRREAIAALLSCSDPHAKQMLSQAQAYASADEIRSVQHDLNKTF